MSVLTVGSSATRALISLVFVFMVAQAAPVLAGFPVFKQAVAEYASTDAALAEFYRERGYAPVWTGQGDAERRHALLTALERAPVHGLPAARYAPHRLRETFADIRTERDRGRVEVETSRLFLRYARDIQSGVLEPGQVDGGLAMKVPRRDRLEQITAFAAADPHIFLRELAPRNPHYVRLLKEKLRLERVLRQGGWGPALGGGKLEPGDSGADVVALRNRLVRMGYMNRSAASGYDSTLQSAVQRFQTDHGLASDGVAGPDTIGALNVPARERLKQVVVGLERARWLNKPLGERHILVNQAAFTAYVVDDGKVSFETRVVIGKRDRDLRTPEFSDEMEHLIVNPTWHVPRSIATEEYLPQLKRNPNAAGHLRIYDVRGRVVDRSRVDFTRFNKRNFPFDMKEPPSRGNALGLVKFMFPNRFNIYLHDTPAKSLFGYDRRAFSHGCVRVQDPFDLAYTLLSRQTDNPEALFHRTLQTGRETQINLERKVPVHLTYRTVWVDPKGQVNYRDDVYGRDARIFDALTAAGVALNDVQS
ncbi:murein L,D-transpeptidase [Maritimibacter sp. 55A14]|uniref:L,D-transpeptidase family protein n=1 Tax=Maritimibacter sp. 55A14 TaxID=2174844 RepID=UPI001E4BCD12|nr:L,D-transpeptidase family protein [Maritimibacter sp. 55A14]